MVLVHLNSSYLEQLALKGLSVNYWTMSQVASLHLVQIKKVPLVFCCCNFSWTTSQENAKALDARISYHAFVLLLPYRVKVSDTKVTHFTQY